MIDPRDRVNEGMSRARVAVEVKRSVQPLLVVLVGTLIGLVCFAYLLSNVAGEVYRPSQKITFEVDSLRAVVPGVQDAKVRGIKAGSITKAELVDGRAYLTVDIEDEYGPIYANARARLAPKTILEDMFLDIVDPGDESAGLADRDEPLPRRQTELSESVGDVLQAFESDTRKQLTTLLDELGGGVSNRGRDLRQAFVRLVPFLESVDELATQIASRKRLTRRLIANASVLADELALRERGLRTLVSDGAATLGTIAGRSSEFEATLAELPPTLAELGRSFTALGGILGDVDGALEALGPVADDLGPGLAALRDLSEALGPAVSRLREPVRELRPFADSLPPVAGQLRRSFVNLRPQAPQVDYITQLLVGCRFAIDRFFQWNPSVFKMGDQRGVAPRAFVVGGLGSMSEFRDPSVTESESCAPGSAIGGEPGPGGTR